MLRLPAALLLLASLLSPHATAAERVLLAQDFDAVADGTTLDKLGWRLVDPGNTCRLVVKDKALRLTSLAAPRLRGGYAEIEVPLCVRGVLEFDVTSDHDDRGGIGLYVDLYNITTFWHEYCGDWRRYFAEPVAKRLIGFNQEPVGHRPLAKFARHKPNHYRIAFDKSLDRVEYYLNDMKDPVYIDGGVPVWGRSEYLGGFLRLGNWGSTANRFDFTIDNLKLTSLDTEGDAPAAEAERDQIMLFSGLSSGRYAIRQALEAGGVPAERIREYLLQNTTPALGVENNFAASRLPGLAATARTATFVLSDFPVAPAQIIPDCVLDDIVANVRKGARLVILGGMYSYARGGYGTSPLVWAVPLKMSTCWDVVAQDPPAPIAPAGDGLPGLDWSGGPTVSYLHTLEPDSGAKVLLTAGGRPFLVSKPLGKGEVLAVLGTAYGVETPAAFWKWSGWPGLVAALVRPPKASTGQ